MNKYWWLIAVFLLLDFLSFLSYFSSAAANLLFFLICITLFIIALFDFKKALIISLAELFVGGFGYLFVLKWAGLNFSLRYAFFLIILGFTLKNIIQERRILFLSSRFFVQYFFLALALLIALINGYLRNYNPSAIFFDFNSFIFLFYLFAFYQNFAKDKEWKELIPVFLVALSWLSLKTIFVYALFVGGFIELGSPFYKWIRDTGVGEITKFNGSLFRVFFQSQVYLIFAVLFIIIKDFWVKSEKLFSKIGFWLLGALFLSSLFLSLSRSFAVGLMASLFVLWFSSVVFLRQSFKSVGFSIVYFISLIGGAAIFVTLLTFLASPLHEPLLFWQTASSRSVSIADPAVATRWAEINPLITGIKQHWLWGSGFGKTLTFKSLDPRILASNPSGLFTTSAFEWGWLDLWLKIGLVGVGFLVLLLCKILFRGWFNVKMYILRGDEQKIILNLFFCFSILALVIVHIFTPYLNHPLGLGWLILASFMIEWSNLELSQKNH